MLTNTYTSEPTNKHDGSQYLLAEVTMAIDVGTAQCVCDVIICRSKFSVFITTKTTIF